MASIVVEAVLLVFQTVGMHHGCHYHEYHLLRWEAQLTKLMAKSSDENIMDKSVSLLIKLNLRRRAP